MRNLFILAGINPILVANSIIRSHHASDENFILIEKNDWDRPELDAAAKRRSQNHLVGMLERLLPAATLLECFPRPTFRGFFEDYRGYLAEARYLMKIGRSIRRQLPARFDHLYYSGNARTQAYFMRHASRWTMIEHGLGDYWFSNVERPFNRSYRLRKLIVRLLTGAMEDFPHDLVLTDGGKCLSFPADHLYGATVSRLPAPELTVLFLSFCNILEQEEPELFKGMSTVLQAAQGHQRVYLFLPFENFAPLDTRRQIFDKQTEALLAYGAKDALFIIKPHPADSLDYTSWFSEQGLRTAGISHPLGRCMPAELYLTLIPHAQAVGCASSTLFYSRWWLNRPTIYVSGGAEAHNAFFARVRADFAKDIATMTVV